MLQNFSIFKTIFNDAPQPWQIGFQDSAGPGFTGIVELHNTIFFFLVVISVGVFWILGSVTLNYSYKNSPIVHKYLNHGTKVPILKCSNNKYNNVLYNPILLLFGDRRAYSVIASDLSYLLDLENKKENKLSTTPVVKYYENAKNMKQIILKENKNKSGIYRLTNKITGDFYIGQSINLCARFLRYYSVAYLNNKSNLIISRALIKYGYFNFSIEILEYCDKSLLLEKEQFYLTEFNPPYNILKIAGSSKGFKHSEKSKNKISVSLKGKYIGENSPNFGRTHSEKAKQLAPSSEEGGESIKKRGNKNPLFEKSHSDETKLLMRTAALGRVHSEETKLLISSKLGNPINLYELQPSPPSSEEGAKEFSLIGRFVSTRKAAAFLGISKSTVIRYVQSGQLFKEKYKFSTR
jgi:group I intron endonuclease